MVSRDTRHVKSTYACAVLVRDVAVLESVPDLFLEFFRQLIVAVHHFCVASAGLDQVFNLLGSNTSPAPSVLVSGSTTQN